MSPKSPIPIQEPQPPKIADKTSKYVYYFAAGRTDGNASMRELLGGKGANLAEMASLGLSVPPGFTISTEACNAYYTSNQTFPAGLWEQVLDGIKHLEAFMRSEFGGRQAPLLVSVRSGARASMPGMMDTILNLGLNETTVLALAEKSQNERFVYDTYRRFIMMFGNVVLNVDSSLFEAQLETAKEAAGVKLDTDISANALKTLCAEFKQIIKRESGESFPEDPHDQLRRAISAVFESWNTERAIIYRRLHDIPSDWGTAVNIQCMVFGNLGPSSGTGVAFTRNPSTGEKHFYGEFLMNAQGEDVVAGIRTPQSVDELQDSQPEIYASLLRVAEQLEHHYRDMQDIEFTIQDGSLYLLQTRTGKRTAAAAIRIAIDMEEEGLIDKPAAVKRVEPGQLDQLLHPTIDPAAKVNVIAKGLPASPGAAVGKVVLTAAEATERGAAGEAVILVRNETSPDDIGGMHAAQGIVTAKGGMTSHAAVVARGMGKCCVAGCSDITINFESQSFSANGYTIKAGDFITLNGTTGQVLDGQVDLVQSELGADFNRLMDWADSFRRLGVRTNADTPHDADVARKFGAEGIGLCRTEHMFFEEDRVMAVREMILANNSAGRRRALEKIRPMQKGDFKEIFRVMQGLPVTVRLLDPPLHEFLPSTEKEFQELADDMGVKLDEIRATVNRLHELNPMLGHRGCRLGISYPEIYAMQVSAIVEAACELTKEGIEVLPEIMIPLVAHVRELEVTREIAETVSEEVMERLGIRIDCPIGTMIELPRAAITADQIATKADFFSYGTNDLTQTTMGLSRDDSGTFLPHYVEQEIFPEDPFVSVDTDGVGELMRIGVEKGRSTRPDLKIGICGEHGGDPKSIIFCHAVKFDYVSCSPFRVPVARLAAAHAALDDEEQR